MQTKLQTLIETMISTVIAFWLSVLIGWIVYPLFGHKFTVVQNMALTGIFTVWSFIRNYWMRRFFNWYFHRRTR
jgi:putative flippase GtrA